MINKQIGAAICACPMQIELVPVQCKLEDRVVA
jgi:hypothetical protein